MESHYPRAGAATRRPSLLERVVKAFFGALALPDAALAASGAGSTRR